VDNVSVFLLGSFANSRTLNLTTQASFRDYFSKAEAAKLTWAKYLKHFYYVVGAGKPEYQIISNPNLCSNRSKTAESFPDYPEDHFEMYNCANIKVLYFRQCSNSPHGHLGPCCRCESSMRYFLHANKHHNLQKKKNNYPDWFIFADDDYFMRTHMLQSVLSNYKNPAHVPYSLNPAESIDTFRSGYGMSIFSPKCIVECVHRLEVCNSFII